MHSTVRLSISSLLCLAACKSDDPSGTGESGSTSASTTDGTASSTGADSGTTGPSGDCGNDMIEEGEECDGVDLGGMTCADINPAYDGGMLMCGASCTFDATGCTLPPDTPLVALNELTSNSVAANMMPNDAIELHNAGTGTADLSGFQLSDDPLLPAAKTYVFPQGTMLAPGEFLVLLSLDAIAMTGDFPFGISDNSEETLVLADAGGAVVDMLTVAGNLARVSYCRVPDGTGAWFQCVQTFGASNMEAPTACGNGMIEDMEVCDDTDLGGATCDGLGLGFSGGTLSCSFKCNLDTDQCTTDSDLVLNELNATSDEIEIFNGGGQAFDLSGLVLTDDDVDATYDPGIDTGELVFPPGTTVPAGGYLVVQPGLGPGQHPFGMGLGGDRITLVDPAGPTIIDHVKYGNAEATISYCRQPNGAGGTWTVDCTPSMGGAN